MVESRYALLERIVNLPELLTRVEGDQEFLGDLFALLREELPSLNHTLHIGIEPGELRHTGTAAHSSFGRNVISVTS